MCVFILFGAVVSLLCCKQVFSSGSKWGPPFMAGPGFLTVGAPPVGGYRLQAHRLSNCGTRLVALARGDLPRPGAELMSLALAGGFLTPGPPGKSVWCEVLCYPRRKSQQICLSIAI